MTLTIQRVEEQALAIKDRTHDYRVRARNVHMGSDGVMIIGDGAHRARPNRRAFGHMTNFLKGTVKNPIAPNIGRATDHLYEDMPSDLRSLVVNFWLSEIASKELLWRAYDHGSKDGDYTLRAVGSNAYGVVDHHHIVDAVKFSFQKDPGCYTVKRCFMDDETLHLRLTVPAITWLFEAGGFKQPYTAGIHITNGTVKNKSVVVMPFIQGGICENTTVFHTEFGLRRSHSWLTPMAAKTHMYEMVSVAMDHSLELMDRMFEAATVDVPSPVDVIAKILKTLGQSDNTLVEEKIWSGMYQQGGVNRLGLSNGLSYAAQSIPDGDDRVAMEMMAGEVILASADDLFGHLAKAKAEAALADTVA